jgi:CheY-like chemotaxis protein
MQKMTSLTIAEAQRLPRPRPRTSRVLVTDDHDDSRELLAAFLMLEGHTVRTAADGREALRICADFQPEIVFLDLCMPGMDGYEVCTRLRQNAATKNAAVYALTAYPHEEPSPDAPLRLFDRYLLKPVELEEIGRLIAGRRETRSPVSG